MFQIFYLLTILTLIGCDTNKGSGDFAVFEGNNKNFQIFNRGWLFRNDDSYKIFLIGT